MTQLQFKNYTFSNTPKQFSLTHQNNIKVFRSSTMGQKAQLLGVGGRVFTAAGTLAEDNLQGTYTALKELFCEESKGVLSLEGIFSFEAYFSKLEITGASGPKALDYKIEFVEAQV